MALASSRKVQPQPQTALHRTGRADDLAIVAGTPARVKPLAAQRTTAASGARRRGRRKTRRQSHGSAWHWKQTDGWYYTLPGTKKRIALFDEDGRRIRGLENR